MPRITIDVAEWFEDKSVRSLGLSDRMLWFEMKALMMCSKTPGTISMRSVKRKTGVQQGKIDSCVEKLQRRGLVTVISETESLYSREVEKEHEIRMRRAAGGASGGNPELTGDKYITRAAVDCQNPAIVWTPSLKIRAQQTHDDYLWCVKWWFAQAMKSGHYFTDLKKDYPDTDPDAVARELFLWLKAHDDKHRTSLNQTLRATWLHKRQNRANFNRSTGAYQGKTTNFLSQRAPAEEVA